MENAGGWGAAEAGLRENTERARLRARTSEARYVDVPPGPMLCGSCGKIGVTRTADEKNATYKCSKCGLTRTIRRVWEADRAATEAMLIAKKVSRGR